MSRNRIVLVANTPGSAATFSAATTLGELNIISESPLGVFAAVTAGDTLAALPKMHISTGNGTGYPLDQISIDGRGVVSWSHTSYTAGYVKSIVAGYDGVNTYNVPVNIYNAAEYILRLNTTDINNDGDRPKTTGKSWSVTSGYNAASADHGRYNILRDLLTLINAYDESPCYAFLRQSETVTVVGANATVVNGSPTVTCTHASAMVAGDFMVIGHSVYKTTAVTATTITLDRNYEGPSATIKYNQAPPADIDVVYGSTTATTTDTTGPDIAAGDYVNLGNAVYVVQSVVAATSFVLDRPYEGATATLTAGVTPGTTAAVLGSAGFVATATIDENTLFGIHCLGNEADGDFTLELEYGFDGDEVVVTKNAVLFSVGTYAEVAAMEIKDDQMFGVTQTMLDRTGRTRKAVSGYTYDKFNITFNNYSTSNMGGYHTEDTELIIWLRSNQTETILDTNLAAWLATGIGSGSFA